MQKDRVLRFEKILECLGNEDCQLYWDEYWDEIAVVSEDDVELIPLLRRALRFETSFAKHFALAALEKIGVSGDDYWEEVKLLLLDEDREIAGEAFKRLLSAKHKTEELPAVLRLVRSRAEPHLFLRMKAIYYLCKIYCIKGNGAAIVYI